MAVLSSLKSCSMIVKEHRREIIAAYNVEADRVGAVDPGANLSDAGEGAIEHFVDLRSRNVENMKRKLQTGTRTFVMLKKKKAS